MNPEQRVVPQLLLSPTEAGASLGVSRATIYRLLGAGSLRAVRIGRSRRIPAAEIEAFVARCLDDAGALAT